MAFDRRLSTICRSRTRSACTTQGWLAGCATSRSSACCARGLLLVHDVGEQLRQVDALQLNRHLAQRDPRGVQQIVQHAGHRGGLSVEPLRQPSDSRILELHERQRVGCRANRPQRIAQLVREHGDELVLLPILLLQRPLGLFQLLALVQLAQAGQLLEQALAHLASISFGVLQQQAGELLVSAHQVPHVVFGFDLRMQHRPVVRGADEGQAAAEELEAPWRRAHGARRAWPRSLRAGSTNMTAAQAKIASSSSLPASGQCRGSAASPSRSA